YYDYSCINIIITITECIEGWYTAPLYKNRPVSYRYWYTAPLYKNRPVSYRGVVHCPFIQKQACFISRGGTLPLYTKTGLFHIEGWYTAPLYKNRPVSYRGVVHCPFIQKQAVSYRGVVHCPFIQKQACFISRGGTLPLYTKTGLFHIEGWYTTAHSLGEDQVKNETKQRSRDGATTVLLLVVRGHSWTTPSPRLHLV
ncbi:hypothetical protein EGW08_013032, partial [Elysia chlorotica]